MASRIRRKLKAAGINDSRAAARSSPDTRRAALAAAEADGKDAEAPVRVVRAAVRGRGGAQ
ncbi:MAG: hypothetical protein LBQ12_12700 [Deltaproteobacteria bacterium]|nr:hypothetical protein [Deltaproteobacteria bacterium]